MGSTGQWHNSEGSATPWATHEPEDCWGPFPGHAEGYKGSRDARHSASDGFRREELLGMFKDDP